MLQIRKSVPDDIPVYQKWHYHKHQKFIDEGLQSPINGKANELLDKMWIIANGDRISGCFLTDYTEEVEESSGQLIHDFVLIHNPDIDETAECFARFVSEKYNREKVFIRLEHYLSQEMELISRVQRGNVYTSITMLKDNFDDTDHVFSDDNILIRSFQNGLDEDRFAVLFYHIFKNISPAFTLEKIRNWTDSWVCAPGFDADLYMIAEKDSQEIGFVAIELDTHNNQYGHLYEIGVIDDVQGQGIAKKLFNKCVNAAIEKGMAQLSTRVREGNQKAYDFFLKLGFRHCFKKSYVRLN